MSDTPVSAAQRGSERRTQPRRSEEAALHYAEQNLLAAALLAAPVAAVPVSPDGLNLLRRAARLYREAAAAAEARK